MPSNFSAIRSNLTAKPTVGLSSILAGGVTRSGKSLHSIMKSAVAGKSLEDQRVIKRTLLKLNTNPNAVVTNVMTKKAIHALGDAGMLKGQFKANAGLAISHAQRVHKSSATTVTPAQIKEQERKEKRLEARLEDRARDEREEAEGHLSEEEVHGPGDGHTHGSIHDTSIGLKAAKAAKVGIGQVIAEKQNRRASVTQLPSHANDEPDEPPRVVEMNIG